MLGVAEPLVEIPIGGWFPEESRQILAELINRHDVKSVIEIGSLFGLSAVWFAQRVDRVTCVDTWYEEANYVSANNVAGTLRRWELPRDFFYLFRENVMRCSVFHKICPVRGNSHYVSGEVEDADLTYLDGDHSYEGCKRDIEIYGPKTRKVLCGDDYADCPEFGVIQAVDELLPKRQVKGRFWWHIQE